MERKNSDQPIDEPNPKRLKIESEGSTSSKPESKDPFLSLPQDIFVKIIGYIPIAQWHLVELVDQNFRAATLIAWRQLRNVDLDRDFLIKPLSSKSIESILRRLVERSPFLSSISGINLSLNSDAVQLLAQFEHLQSISFGDAKFRRRAHLNNIVDFLESTRSRSSLKELHLYNVLVATPLLIDRFAASFVNGQEIQSPLKLEMFSLPAHLRSIDIRLDTMDATRLTDLRVGKSAIEPNRLTDLIERAPELRRIELAFIPCERDCNGPRLQDNKKLLTALASREKLAAIKFDCIGMNRVAAGSNERWYPRKFNDVNCMGFGPEFIEMLKLIGRRGQLRKLMLEYNFLISCESIFPSLDEMWVAIRGYIPYLQSIKLHHYRTSDGSIFDIFDSTTLEGIDFTSRYPVTENAIKKITQLPHLKRLALNADNYQSLDCLADAPALTSLRMPCARLISADVFEKWADGFAPNLEILLLDRIAMDAEEGLAKLLEKAVRLRVLILEGYITDRVLMAIANESCPKLEVLGVRSYSKAITVQPLQEIVHRCSKLKELGGFGDDMRMQLQFPKDRKIVDVDMAFYKYDFDDED